MNYEFATVIITTAVAVNLRKLSQMLDRGETDGMFAVGLSATGSLPATHYISTGMVPEAYVNAITNETRLFNIAKKAYADEGATFPFTQAQVTNALSKCDVSEDNPFAAMDRMGLKMIQPVGA